MQRPKRSPDLPSNRPEGHLIGYARVSTRDQNPDMQIDALIRAGVAESDVYWEKESGAKAARPQLNAMLRELRPGDVVVIWRLDRLSRRVRHLLKLIDQIQGAGASIRFVDQQIDTSTPVGRLILGVLAHVAEFELDGIHDRTRKGLQAARERGRVGGRRQTYKDADIRKARTAIKRGATMAEACQLVKSKTGQTITPMRLRQRIAIMEANEA